MSSFLGRFAGEAFGEFMGDFSFTGTTPPPDPLIGCFPTTFTCQAANASILSHIQGCVEQIVYQVVI